MVRVESDTSKNLLRIAFSEHVGPDDARIGVEEMRQLLCDLSPGFRLVADLSNLDFMDVACAEHLKRSMDLCNKAGVSKVIRIIPDPQKDIGLNIMSKFHYRREIPIVTCDSEAEAMRVLAE